MKANKGVFMTMQKQSPKGKQTEKTGLSVQMTKAEMAAVSELASALGVSKAATVRLMLSVIQENGFTERVKTQLRSAMIKS